MNYISYLFRLSVSENTIPMEFKR